MNRSDSPKRRLAAPAPGLSLVFVVAAFAAGCLATRTRAPEAPLPVPSSTGSTLETNPDAPPPVTMEPVPEAPAGAAAEPATPSASNETVPSAAEPAPPLVVPAVVRIGLATDLESVTLPCCDGEIAVDPVALPGAPRLEVLSPLRILPAARSVGGVTFRVQVAALREEVQASEMAARIARLSGLSADVRFDAAGGLYRVRVGRYATREEADAEGRDLARFGIAAYWVVSEGAALADPALEVVHRGTTYRVPGRRFGLAAAEGAGVRWDGKRYRGRLTVFLNDRGRLNLVNELPLEEYLRGVVPKELGPEQHPAIEALKAQAIAARSYTLRNLGEFAEEGYDLCGTPRCQVYGGMDAEHPLSDRAVAETAGQVMVWEGRAIDALYSATCGGHTENVEVMFPMKRAAYLRGVACIESGVTSLAGAPASGASAAGVVVARFAPSFAAGAFDAERLERALAETARAAGFAGFGTAGPTDRLASLERRELQRYLGSAFDLAADARLFVAPEEVAYLVDAPPADWNEGDRRLAAYFAKSGLLRAAPDEPVTRSEAESLLLELAIFLHVVDERTIDYSRVGGGELVGREEASEVHFRLPPRLATFREWKPAATARAAAAGERRAAILELVPGDELVLYVVRDELVEVVQRVDPAGAAFDRAHKRSAWTRFKSDEELRKAVAARLPGFSYKSFEILTRGVSGRVGKIRLESTTGESVEVDGLPVRWTLDVPDTFFTARRLTPKNGPSGWQFAGRGWGHGVGLCQTGAYGMALRGHGAGEILEHYYRGAKVATAVTASGTAPAP